MRRVAARSLAGAAAVALLLMAPPASLAPAQSDLRPGDDPGSECSGVSIGGTPPTASGGCAAVTSFSPARFSVLTMAGAVPFDTCAVQIGFRASDGGEVGTIGFGADNVVPGEGACGDIVACRWEDGPPKKVYDWLEYLPWSGTIARSGANGYLVELDVCLNTCLGRFEGKLELRLTRKGKGWRAATTDGTVGTSGLRIDGEWDLEWERGSAPPALPG